MLLRYVSPIVFAALVCAAHGQRSYHHPVLDDLTQSMRTSGSQENMRLIDAALREAAPDRDQRVTYFLRRYRCEQLYYQIRAER